MSEHLQIPNIRFDKTSAREREVREYGIEVYRRLFLSWEVSEEWVEKIASRVVDLETEWASGSPSQHIKAQAQKDLGQWQEAGLDGQDLEALNTFWFVRFCLNHDYELSLSWLTGIGDPGRIVVGLLEVIGIYRGDDSATVDHPLFRQIIDYCRDVKTPQEFAELLRSVRHVRLLSDQEGPLKTPLPEDKELDAMGMLQGTGLDDWREFTSRLPYSSAPWNHLCGLITEDSMWGKIPQPERQLIVTRFGCGLDTALQDASTRGLREDFRHVISDWRQEYGESTVWDEMRFIYAFGLYVIGEPARGQNVALDITAEAYTEDLVETLMDTEKVKEAWGLTRAIPNGGVVARILLSDSWPDAQEKHQKLQDIIEPISKRTKNKFPPWLRTGCAAELAAQYEESGMHQDAQRYRSRLELLKNQLTIKTLQYNGDGSWK